MSGAVAVGLGLGPFQARIALYSDQNLGQVPGGENTNCRECHGMLSSVLSLERLFRVSSPRPTLSIDPVLYSLVLSAPSPVLAPALAQALAILLALTLFPPATLSTATSTSLGPGRRPKDKDYKTEMR